ncbi:PRC-barrel domain-containing protein [Inquilinus limosus]|uniref:Photosystem reaction center subunit H n=1 Tax=Inquilinus limosus TaxID=171674 RepID=A0A211ZFC6_9PROT|nr:PRC-barrel domain-containing protein [Inquilinus limosus]OWJ63992.1 photosystem reaction center subunit H [Inquilinus limosus]
MQTETARDLSSRETHRLIASDKVERTPIRRPNGDRIGTIQRVMIDKRTGRVGYAVMTFGGFLGIGEDYYALSWSMLTYNEALDAYELDVSEDQLRGAPAHDRGERFDWDDRQWAQQVHDYYRVPPYWM